MQQRRILERDYILISKSIHRTYKGVFEVGERKSDKKNAIWIYAVILFTSAFIVLLLTAYSQIKFNKNIDEYKSRISSGEREKLNFQTNLSTALDENKKIKNELQKLSKEVDSSRIALEEKNKQLDKYKNNMESTIQAYEALLAAEREYNNGNIIDCAMILKKKCNYNLLNKEAVEKYTYLTEKSFMEAAQRLYYDGYKSFKLKEYRKAIEKFQQSIELTDTEYFSDDSLFFMAYSEYNLGNKEAARNHAKRLIDQYPSSNYSKELIELLK